MAWPSLSSITEGVKSAIAGDAQASEPATEAAPVAAATPAAPAEAKTTEPAAVASDSPTSTEPAKTTEPAATTEPSEPLPAALSKFIAEKGVKAFLALLPDEAKEQIGPEVNKKWYTRVNQADAENRALREQLAALPAVIQQQLDERFDALLTAGMSDEDKKAFTERKELERLRAQDKAIREQPAPLSREQQQALVANHPTTAAFWQIVSEAGLPQSTDDPRVRAVWQEAFNAPTPEAALATMRAAAAKHTKKADDPKPAPVDADAVKKLAVEMAEQMVTERFKKAGLLAADTGKPGGSGGVSDKPKTYAEARKATEQYLRENLGR